MKIKILPYLPYKNITVFTVYQAGGNERNVLQKWEIRNNKTGT